LYCLGVMMISQRAQAHFFCPEPRSQMRACLQVQFPAPSSTRSQAFLDLVLIRQEQRRVATWRQVCASAAGLQGLSLRGMGGSFLHDPISPACYGMAYSRNIAGLMPRDAVMNEEHTYTL